MSFPFFFCLQNSSFLSTKEVKMSSDTAESVSAQIASQGAIVKALKLSGKTNDDPDVSSAVSHLKQLKAKLAELTGVEEIVGGREKKKKRTEEGKNQHHRRRTKR